MKCPKCGGTTGYEFNVAAKQVWTGLWKQPVMDWKGSTESKEEFIDSVRDRTDKTVKCLDCGARIKRINMPKETNV